MVFSKRSNTLTNDSKLFIEKHSNKKYQLGSKKMRVIDLGKSGLKTITFKGSLATSDLINLTPVSITKPDYKNFIPWLKEVGFLDSDNYGVSVPGIVTSSGEVKFSHATGWQNRALKNELDNHLEQDVLVLNDAEAHLFSHLDFDGHPQMCIALGSSLGFATTDKRGRLLRAGDCANLEVGQIPLVTRASNKQVWWALGSDGLNELQHNLGEVDGVKQFGYRLGNFLATLVAIYRPSTIYLTGGIVEKMGTLFLPMVKSELEKTIPDWLKKPQLYLSPFGQKAGLIGLMKYIYYNR